MPENHPGLNQFQIVTVGRLVYKIFKKMRLELLKKEIVFRASRSSGAGGQHVNKVATKVTLLFDVKNSKLLSEEQKQLVLENLQSRISKEGILQISCQTSRSQTQNKEASLKLFFNLLGKAVRPPKKRKKVKPLAANPDNRLKSKRLQSEKKDIRKKVIA
jgi:ribosome-associated protein